MFSIQVIYDVTMARQCMIITSIVLILISFSAMTYHLVSKRISFMKELEKMEQDKRCMMCCMRNDVCAMEEPCRNRVDPNICDVVMKKQYATSTKSGEKIKQVIGEILEKETEQIEADAHINRRYSDADRLRFGLHNLDLMVQSPNKPMTHVPGSKFNHTVEHENRVLQNISWPFHSSESLNIMYQDPFNKVIQIPHNGVYGVYLHTTFHTQHDNIQCSFGHVIKRHNEEDNFRNHEILKSVENRVCGSPLGGGSKTWSHTLDSTGVHRFNKGDLLAVDYLLPHNVSLGSRGEESYFGVFMV